MTRDRVKSYLSEIASAGKYAHGTLKNILATLRAVLSHAVDNGFLAGNPAARKVLLAGSQEAQG